MSVPRSSALDFVLEATEESIVKQLKELLKTRDLTSDELGLLYCYKHGVSTNQALKTIGIDAKLAPLLHFSEESRLGKSRFGNAGLKAG